MKIKYGTMGIVALTVYYTIKWYSALGDAIDIIAKDGMGWEESVVIALAFCLPIIFLFGFNDR